MREPRQAAPAARCPARSAGRGDAGQGVADDLLVPHVPTGLRGVGEDQLGVALFIERAGRLVDVCETFPPRGVVPGEDVLLRNQRLELPVSVQIDQPDIRKRRRCRTIR